MVRQYSEGFQNLMDFFPDGLYLARGIGAADYEEIGEAVFPPHIQQHDIAGQLFTGGVNCLTGGIDCFQGYGLLKASSVYYSTTIACAGGTG